MCVCLCVSGDRSGAVSRLPRVHKAGSKRQSQSFCGQLQLLRDNWTRFSFGSGTSRHRHLLHLAPQERTSCRSSSLTALHSSVTIPSPVLLHMDVFSTFGTPTETFQCFPLTRRQIQCPKNTRRKLSPCVANARLLFDLSNEEMWGGVVKEGDGWGD